MRHKPKLRTPVAKVAWSLQECADALGLHIGTVTRLVALGDIPSIKLGNRRLVPVAAIDALLSEAAEMAPVAQAPAQQEVPAIPATCDEG